MIENYFQDIFKFLLILLVGGLTTAQAQSPDRDELFRQANELYELQEFEKARDIYRQLAENNLSSNVFFNLGNTDFRLGKLGEASLWFRRAAYLDPGMTEARQNLRLLQRELKSFRFKQSGIERVIGFWPARGWVYLAFTGAWLFAIGLAVLWVLRPRQSSGGLVLALTVCGLIIAVLGTTANVLHSRYLDPSKLAIVTADGVVALSGPYPDAKEVIALPPGTEVRIRSDRDQWMRVQVPVSTDTVGWVERSKIEPLWPYPGRP